MSACKLTQVMELRQLKEDEQSLLERSVIGMKGLFDSMLRVRAQQGHALTRLELNILMKEPEEDLWAQVCVAVCRPCCPTLVHRPALQASGIPESVHGSGICVARR